MPTKAEKKLAQMRQRQRNWARRDVVKVLRWEGFVEETDRGRGSHVFYFHPDFPQLDLTLPSDDPVRIYIIKRLLELTDELRKLREP